MMRQFGLEVTRARGLARVLRPARPATPRPPDSRSRPTSARPCSGWPPAPCTPSKVTFRSPTTIAGHPEAAVLDNLMAAGVPFRIAEDRALDLDRPRRHPARGRPARLPRHPRHGPDPVGAGQPGPRAQRARPRRARAPQGVRPRRLDAPAAQDGRPDRVRRQRHDVRGRGAAARREAVLVQRPSRADGAGRRRVDRGRRDRAVLSARLPDLLSRVPRPHERARHPSGGLGRRPSLGGRFAASVGPSAPSGQEPR